MSRSLRAVLLACFLLLLVPAAGQAKTINGCVIAPHTRCIGADLRGADLRGANLNHAVLRGVDLTHFAADQTRLTGSRIDDDAALSQQLKTDATAKDGLFYRYSFILLAHDQYGGCNRYSSATDGHCSGLGTGPGAPGFEQSRKVRWDWSGGRKGVFNHWARLNVVGEGGAEIVGWVTANWHGFDVTSITGLPAGVRPPGHGPIGQPGGMLSIDLRDEETFYSCGRWTGLKCRRAGYQMHLTGWLLRDYTGPVPDAGYRL